MRRTAPCGAAKESVSLMDMPIRTGASVAAPAPRPAILPRAVAGDVAELGKQPETLPGFPKFGVVHLAPEQATTPQARQAIAEGMAAQLKAWPELTAVVGVLPAGNNTQLIVASQPDAIEDSHLEGVYEILQRLSSSDSVRQAAAAHPDAMQAVRSFDGKGIDQAITLGGHQTLADVASELSEGAKPSLDNQLRDLLASLPHGQRCVILVGGPSAAGKSSLISQLTDMAAKLGRKVVDYTGDNYFRNSDDPKLPLTQAGTPYWDAPDAMDMPALASDIGTLVSTGHVQEPVYDFSAKSPNPAIKWSGMRTDKTTPVELGGDDILCIDSLHAMNPAIIQGLENDKLPYVCVYLDSSEANIREVRRIVRDFTDRGRSAEQSIADWKDTTFPGEKKFVRPDIDELVPGRDVFRITSFPADVKLSQDEIDDRVKVQEQYGVQPTYAAFRVADADMAAFARTEVTRFQGIIDNAKSTPDQVKAAQAGLASLQAAPDSVVPR